MAKERQFRPLSAHDSAIMRDYLRSKAEQGIPMTEQEARQSKEFKHLRRTLGYRSNKPTSEKAKTLAKLGRRKPEWDFAVGETPDEEAVA